jgi:hypothetical protein
MTSSWISTLEDWLHPKKREVVGSSGTFQLIETLHDGSQHSVEFQAVPTNSLVMRLEDNKRGIFTFWDDRDDSVCPYRKMCDAIVLLQHKGSVYCVYVELKTGDHSGAVAQFRSSQAISAYLIECLRLTGAATNKVKERFILCTRRRMPKRTRSTSQQVKVEGVNVHKTDQAAVNLLALLG